MRRSCPRLSAAARSWPPRAVFAIFRSVVSMLYSIPTLARGTLFMLEEALIAARR
jgi:hypothetical protein